MKLLKFLLILVTISFLTACGSGSTDSSNTNSNTETNTTTTDNNSTTSDTNTTTTDDNTTTDTNTSLGLDDNESEAFTLINQYRTSAGLTTLQTESLLNDAAYNHSNYLYLNNTISHYEVNTSSGFTGTTPGDRADYLGYTHIYLSENVSAGQTSSQNSIDDLMSAIYHRFGFLDNSIDVIGIGIVDDRFTYDMSNSVLNALCEGESYNGSGSYYPNMCGVDGFKIEATTFDTANAQLPLQNPTYVIWPPASATDITPVFYEESPDPLTDYSVSGYPVSIEFNSQKISSVENVSFTLWKNGVEVTNTRVIDESSDVNGYFSSYQFALFPLERLAWGTQYDAVFSYDENGTISKTINWSFTTSTPADTYFTIAAEDSSGAFNVTSGETTAVYFEPSDGNDSSLGSVSYSYSAQSVNLGFVDANTLDVNITGSTGQYVQISTSNGKSVTLTIQ